MNPQVGTFTFSWVQEEEDKYYLVIMDKSKIAPYLLVIILALGSVPLQAEDSFKDNSSLTVSTGVHDVANKYYKNITSNSNGYSVKASFDKYVADYFGFRVGFEYFSRPKEKRAKVQAWNAGLGLFGSTHLGSFRLKLGTNLSLLGGKGEFVVTDSAFIRERDTSTSDISDSLIYNGDASGTAMEIYWGVDFDVVGNFFVNLEAAYFLSSVTLDDVTFDNATDRALENDVLNLHGPKLNVGVGLYFD